MMDSTPAGEPYSTAPEYQPGYQANEPAQTPTEQKQIGFNTGYITSRQGILRLIEIVLSVIVLICAAHGGAPWVQFVGAWCFITILIWFILCVVGINENIPGPVTIMELIYFIILTIFNLTGGIVSAIVGFLIPMAVAAVFCFACMLVLGIDCLFLFQTHRQGFTALPSRGQPSTTL